MSSDDLPELEHDALAALRDAKTLVDPGDEVRARMRARLLAALPPPPGGGDGDGGDGGDGAGEPARAPAPLAPSGLPKVPLWTVAAALAVGAAAGLLYPRAPVERVVTVHGPPLVVAPASSPSSPSLPPPAPSLPSVDPKDLPSVASAVASASSAASAPRNGNELAAERALLDVARTALGRGDGANALLACDDHARKFPRGALSEEREAIAVQALVLDHRSDDARIRAERFRKTHPRSILLPAVLAAAGVEP